MSGSDTPAGGQPPAPEAAADAQGSAAAPPPMTPGAPLVLPSAIGGPRLVLSRENTFVVTGRRGDIFPPGARDLGLFSLDTRHLSHYALILPGAAPTLLSSEVESSLASQIDLTTTDEEFGGLLGEPINVIHIRRRQVLDGDFSDHLAFNNHTGRSVQIEFEVRFGADFADIFEVRGARRTSRGELLTPKVGVDDVTLGYRGLDGESYSTLLKFHPAPVEVSETSARFQVTLPPGATHTQDVVVRCARGALPPPRPRRALATRLAVARGEVCQFLGDCTRVRCDDALILRALERSLSDVFALRVSQGDHWIVSAGIPWFAAPFGRDALITSAQVLAFAPHLAAETLRFLAHWQGREIDTYREEEPGKILHELRRGEMVRTREIPHAPYYGSIDSTPLFVVLAGELLRWTGDLAFIDSIWPAMEAAMAWLDRRTAGGVELLQYEATGERGLRNQGWKDSRDGVPFPDGSLAELPIALIEVQGYAIDAWRQAAWMAEMRGDAARAAAWRARADAFVQAVERAFWIHEHGFYALAIDGRGRRVPTLTSNPGHLLWSRAIEPGRARRVASILLSPEMYSGWAIRTLARGQAVYNPLSYHNGSAWPHDNAIAALGMARYGFGRQALRVFGGLLAASEHFAHQRLPELFCGMERGEREFLVHYPVSCSPQAWAAGSLLMGLQAVLGLEPDALRGHLSIRNPRLPPSVHALELLDLRVGPARLDLRFVRSGAHTHAEVLDIRDGPIRVEIEVSPSGRAD